MWRKRESGAGAHTNPATCGSNAASCTLGLLRRAGRDLLHKACLIQTSLSCIPVTTITQHTEYIFIASVSVTDDLSFLGDLKVNCLQRKHTFYTCRGSRVVLGFITEGPNCRRIQAYILTRTRVQAR